MTSRSRAPSQKRFAGPEGESTPGRARTPRTGAMLLELIICGLLLGVVFSAAIPTLGWVARERQFSRQQQAALLEAGNLMERLMLLDWDELTPEKAATIELSAAFREQFPEATLTISIAAADSAPDARRLLVELRWETGPGRPAPAVRLAGFVYRDRVVKE